MRCLFFVTCVYLGAFSCSSEHEVETQESTSADIQAHKQLGEEQRTLEESSEEAKEASKIVEEKPPPLVAPDGTVILPCLDKEIEGMACIPGGPLRRGTAPSHPPAACPP